MSIEIQSRHSLHRSFQQRLRNTQDDLEEDQTLENDRNMLKTYIIESNISSNEFIQTADFVESYNKIDQNLFKITIQEDGENIFYLDSQDERFWSLYTLVGSQLARQIFQKITTTNGNGLDRPWIPNKTQRTFEKFGEFQGAGLKQLGEDTFPEDFVDVSDFRLTLEGKDAAKFYSEFDEQSHIQDRLSLSRIKVRTERESGDFITQRITNEGAFTARGGTNIDIHLETVDKVKEKYRTLVNAIEKHHRLQYQGLEEGVNVGGEHIRIDLSNTIKDIPQFTSHLINAKKPFRLMGPTTKISEDYYKSRAIDLHNGDKVTLEIGRTWIRIYLPEDACGNTALRIFTNLQHYYDPSSVIHIKGVENV